MQDGRIIFPKQVVWLIGRLEEAGCEAFAVGGCVRDSLLGRTPHDWDLCTSATPAQTAAIFSDLRVLETGARHGTVSVLLEGQPYEVTTYRVEGAYSDRRRPDAVFFSTALQEDLSRRDFTINAMAAHPLRGLMDFHEGCDDLKKRRVRCVGVARERFAEDPLRVMRALRFAAALDFEVEQDTGRALRASAELLRLVAAERLGAELCGLLRGVAAGRLLADFEEVFAVLLPPLFVSPLSHALWQQAASAVSFSEAEPSVCLYQLVCGSVKQSNFTLEIEEILRPLRLERRLIQQVCGLMADDDTEITAAPEVLCGLLRRLRPEGVSRLLLARRARLFALPEAAPGRLEQLETLERSRQGAERLLCEGACYDRSGLKLDGSQLLAAGFLPGKELGRVLDRLVDAVIAGEIDNRREELLAYALSLNTRERNSDSNF